MSGVFAVPDWDASGAPSISFQFNKKKLKASNKKKAKVETSQSKSGKLVAKTALVPGQYVRLSATSQSANSPAKNNKRKHVEATKDQQGGKKNGNPSSSPAKKQKLNQTASKMAKQPPKQTKTREHDKYANLKKGYETKKTTPFGKNKGEKPVKPFAKQVEVKKPQKKAVKVKPAKKLELADEESDSELAAEVNKFRKQLLKGFSGPRESSGNDEVDFSDNDDLDFSESDDEPTSKKKSLVETKVKEKAKIKSVEQIEDEGLHTDKTPSADDSFRNKLIGNLKGSRFRFLNEILYTSDGSNAVKLFKQDRAAFTAYHDGYRQQVEQWPLNPLDRIIKSIKKMPKTLVIADFGCGEGRLAKAVLQKTYSLDLVAQRHEIIACDMAKTPLETGSIDVAVYCLSLMGTNLKDFLLEANRVLNTNGILKIAEVESRFEDVRQFVENVKKCGFQHINTDSSSKFFVFLNFKKVSNVDKASKQVPSFSLKPCLYKKR